MEKIIVRDGKEYADILYVTATIKIPLWGRIKNVFCPEVIIQHKIFTKDIMPAHAVEGNLTFVSYLDKIKRLFERYKGLQSGVFTEEFTLQEAKDFIDANQKDS